LGEASFDGAYAVESLEHFADKQRFFERARYHLEAGARLIVTGWQAPQPSRLCDRICAAAQMPRLASGADYVRLAEAADFGVEKVEDWTALVSPTWWRMAGVLMWRPRFWWVGLKHWDFSLAALRICRAFHNGALRYAFTSFKAR
jgi:tocopherol O-methyltransferase